MVRLAFFLLGSRSIEHAVDEHTDRATVLPTHRFSQLEPLGVTHGGLDEISALLLEDTAQPVRTGLVCLPLESGIECVVRSLKLFAIEVLLTHRFIS